MKTETKNQAIDLLKEGVDIPEIAENLGVSIASVYRWKKEAEERGEFDDDPDYMPDKSELIDYDSKEDSPAVLIGKKRRAIKRFKKIFKELRLNVVGCRWATNDLVDEIDKMEDLQDTIEDIFNFDQDKYMNNLLWRSLEIFMERLEELKPIGRQSVDIIFDYEQDRLDEIDKLIEVSEFDEEFDGLAHERLELERDKRQLFADILSYEDNDLDLEDTKGLISRLKAIQEHYLKAGLGSEELHTLLSDLLGNLKELRTEIKSSWLFKSSTLNIPSDTRAEIEELMPVNLNEEE